MPSLRPQLADVQPNVIFRVGAAVHGRTDIIHLEYGEPFFPVAEHIVAAAQKSLRDERQGYCPGEGMLFLREAIAARMGRVSHIACEPDQVIATAGGTGALMTTLLTLCSAGDDVLIPDPAWPCYDGMLLANGARMVRYPLVAKDGWQPDFAALESLITPSAKVLLLNSPANPCGSVFSRATIERLVEIAEAHDLWIVSDECYDEFSYVGEHVSPAHVASKDRVIVVGTCSKSYAMTGWRAGWLIAPRRLVRALALAATAQINNLPLFVQRAATAALTGPQDGVATARTFYMRHGELATQMCEQAGMPVPQPAGAFYLLLPLERFYAETSGRTFDSVEFTDALIAERQVAVAPGAAFGSTASGYVRISLASSESDLRQGIAAILEFARAQNGR